MIQKEFQLGGGFKLLFLYFLVHIIYFRYSQILFIIDFVSSVRFFVLTTLTEIF